MDKKITVRYFKISKMQGNNLNFEDALERVFKSGNNAYEREMTISNKIIRLERFAEAADYFDGEIVRKQIDNIPPEASNEGLLKLSFSESGGLGHCVAFRYSKVTEVLAMQFDNRAVSIRLFLNYLEMHLNMSGGYYSLPVLADNAWDKYNRGDPTKFKIEVASLKNFDNINIDLSLKNQIKALSEISRAPIVSIEFKMGHNRGILKKGFISDIIKSVLSSDDENETIKKLQVVSKNEEGSEELDFIHFLLKQSENLELSSDDPDANYEVRRQYLISCFNEKYAYIKDVGSIFDEQSN